MPGGTAKTIIEILKDAKAIKEALTKSAYPPTDAKEPPKIPEI